MDAKQKRGRGEVVTAYEPHVCGKIKPASAVSHNLTNIRVRIRVFNRHGRTRFRGNPSAKLAARLETTEATTTKTITKNVNKRRNGIKN